MNNPMSLAVLAGSTERGPQMPGCRGGEICRHGARRAPRRPGITQLDAALLVAGILVGLALLMPVLQASQASARRRSCTDHLRRIGLAVIRYCEQHNRFPAVNTRVPKRHGWAAQVLPQLDQQQLYERYDFSVDWCDPINAAPIATTVPFFECPAASYPGRMASGATRHPYRGAVLDYLATNRVSPRVVAEGWFPRETHLKGILSRAEWCHPSEVRDGLSQTTLLAEVAGTPAKYVFRDRDPEPMYGDRGFGAWADAGIYIQGHGHQPDGRRWPGRCTVNCTNDDAIYSFHRGGANVLMGDGAVRFLSEELDLFVLLAGITRANGELLAAGDLGCAVIGAPPADEFLE